MESKIKLLGHPIHPMLIVYPLGLLSTAVLFDVLYLLSGNEDLATFAYWALIAGLVGGLAAAVFGLWDWIGVPRGTRAKRIGLWHGTGNVVVVVLFGVALFLRAGDPTYLPSITPMIPGL